MVPLAGTEEDDDDDTGATGDVLDGSIPAPSDDAVDGDAGVGLPSGGSEINEGSSSGFGAGGWKGLC